MTEARVIIRAAKEPDFTQLATLMAAHAAFERATFHAAGLQSRWCTAMLGPGARAMCVVAEAVTSTGNELVGYATCSAEFSTWRAIEFLHMDTLFVIERCRGLGIGQKLFDAIESAGRGHGLTEIQWQTPDWNLDAIRFYERLGATGSRKVRFVRAIKPDTVTHRETLDQFTCAWEERNLHDLRMCLHQDVRYSPSVAVSGAPFIGIEQVLTGIAMMWNHDDGAGVDLGPIHESLNSITRTWAYHFEDAPSQYGVDVFTFDDGLIIHKDAFRRGLADDT
jgi:GNAT superfamily N-acetyltransferase